MWKAAKIAAAPRSGGRVLALCRALQLSCGKVEIHGMYVALRARMTGIFTANNWYGFPVKGDGFGDDPDDD